MRYSRFGLSVAFLAALPLPAYSGSVSGTLSVTIQPAQSQPLMITLSPTTASLACNVAPGALVSAASTTGGDGNPVTFSLAVPSGFTAADFAIDPNKGTVSVGANGIVLADCGKSLNLTVTANQT